MKRKCKRASLLSLLLLPMSALLLSAAEPNTQFETQILAAHNIERAGLGLPPLTWDDELAVGAKQWSSYLAKARRFEHSPNEPGAQPVGENIWGGTAGRFQPVSMVGLWIAEKQHYQPGVFPRNSRTGDVRDVSHYTQVIWRQTTKVGCGISRAYNEDILVCRYARAGNIIGGSPV